MEADMKNKLPNFRNKLVTLGFSANSDGSALFDPRWEIQGGRLFLIGTQPKGGSTNDWCAGIEAAIAWDQVTDYLVFDSPEHYRKRLAIFEKKKSNR